MVPYQAEITGQELCVVNSNIACFKDVIIDNENGFICLPKPGNILKKVEHIINLPLNKKKLIIKNDKIRALKQMDSIFSYKNSLNLLKKYRPEE